MTPNSSPVEPQLSLPTQIAGAVRTALVDFPYFLAYTLYEQMVFGSASRLPIHPGTEKQANLVLNGGSIASLPPGELPKGDFFVCNEFCRTERFLILRPKYYVLCDQQYYSGSITATGKPVRVETLAILNEATNWDLIVFVPLEARREGLDQLLTNPHIQLTYFSKAPLPGSGFLSRLLFLKTGSMPYLSNVSVAMVSIAVKLGYQSLEIYGLDMTFYRNFMVDNQNQSFIRNSYFYDSERLEPYMISAKTKGGYTRGNATIFFQRMYETLAAHEQLADLTEGIVKITNHSQDSVVDVYERTKL